jgi:hypothetical protein
MLEFTEKLIEYLAVPHEVFAPAKNDGRIMEAYGAARRKGKGKGYTPLLIVPDETLWEYLALDFGDGLHFTSGEATALREQRLKEAAGLDPADFFQNARKSGPGPIEGDNILAYFTSHWDYENNQTFELILAEIPTKNPWELAAWLPMGGFNECPAPEIQVAVMKLWHEKYGAKPALVTSWAWELTVPKPLSDTNEALHLARQHYAFCPDRVDNYGRGEYHLGNLADSLMKSAIWYFSWE